MEPKCNLEMGPVPPTVLLPPRVLCKVRAMYPGLGCVETEQGDAGNILPRPRRWDRGTHPEGRGTHGQRGRCPEGMASFFMTRVLRARP